jgi:hypothetical protein
VRIESSPGPGAQFLQARGALAAQISIADDFELTDEEIDQLLDERVWAAARPMPLSASP